MRQHWIPQFYLRYFAVPGSQKGREQVWAISRNKNDPLGPTRPHVKRVAAEKFLYSPKSADGSRDFKVESKLSDLEGLMATIWPDISGTTIHFSESVKRGLSLFLATMFLRNPARRKTIAMGRRQLVELIERELQKYEVVPPYLDYTINGEHCLLAVDDFLKNKNTTDEDLHHAFVDQLERNAIEIATLLMRKRWTFIVSDLPVFVTSDHPLILRKEGRDVERVGFGVPGMTVKFPVSPHVLLHLDDGEGARVSPLRPSPLVPSQAWAPFNWDVWVNAERFMFCSRDPTDVLEEIVYFCDDIRARERSIGTNWSLTNGLTHAGAFMSSSGTTWCKLCNVNEAIEKSHVIPAFVFRAIKSDSLTGYFRCGRVPNQRRQDGDKLPLLCGECEQRFGVAENEFARNIFYPFHAADQCRFSYGEWLHYFATSLAWRTLILDIDSLVENPSMRPEIGRGLRSAAETMRQYLLGAVNAAELVRVHALVFVSTDSCFRTDSPVGPNVMMRRSAVGYTLTNLRHGYAAIVHNLAGFISVVMIKGNPRDVWHNTRVKPQGGELGPPQRVSSWVIHDLLSAISESYHKTQLAMSDRQRTSIEHAIENSSPTPALRHHFRDQLLTDPEFVKEGRLWLGHD